MPPAPRSRLIFFQALATMPLPFGHLSLPQPNATQTHPATRLAPGTPAAARLQEAVVSTFTHLHVHSEFSLLDGLARLGDLCQYAKQSGMTALALTDHGQMYGMIKFSRAASRAGIKPIYGVEMYQAPRRLDQKDAQYDSKAFHLVLLAKNLTGYQNLLKLTTIANLEGFYYRPRIDKETLARHAEGLICLSACIGGEVPSLIVNGQLDKAREAVGWFKEVFGADNYFLELQRHAGVPELERVNPQLVALAREFGLRCVATNDVHYVRQEDAEAQELLLAIQTNSTMADANRIRMGSDDYYLMTPEEMARHLPEYPEALENTMLVAEQCNVDLGFTGYHLPRFPVPEGHTAESYLRQRCEEGLIRRYGQETPEIRERLEYELGVIHQMGFDDYFLINADLVNWAKNEARMLVGPGRGSGASSLVGYVLGITDLEPLSLGLLFERFLNPGRVTMPDIDLDYPEDRRGEVIDYLTRRYGEDKTAQIATFGTMMARGAIRDVGRALGIPLNEVDYVAKLVPSGPKKTIQDGLDTVPELKELYETQPHIRKLIDYSMAVQGLSRHFSTHAAGVLIADRPLVEYAPLQRAPRGEGIVAQFCMEDVEAIGLLKLDVLGLSTLTVLDRAFRWIERTRGITLTQQAIPMDDPESFALLSSGEVTGIFQVESAGMRRTLREMQPTEFREIVAALALYRPGPMQFIPDYIARKFGREEVVYRHPRLEPILAETYGIIVYQEQILQIASQLAGYSLGEADLMRRAVGKKKKEDLERQHAKFVQGAVANGIPQDVAEDIFADIELFANYGFVKTHSAAYAVITLQTAYLKAHYPAEYMTALLSVERGNLEKVAVLVAECRRLGIEVRPPDINFSDVDYRLEPASATTPQQRDALRDEEQLAIRYGLGGIKNVGDGPAQAIVEARGDEPFQDLDDFVRRVDLRQINKRVLECLIRAGALDALGERAALLSIVDQMIAESQQIHHAREIGQRSLFDFSPDIMADAGGAALAAPRDVPPLPDKLRLADERELLGVYMSTHPLDALTRVVDERLTSISELSPTMAGEQVQVAGMLNTLRTILTKKGDTMAFAQLEDPTGSAELVIFPRRYDEHRELLTEDALLHVHAKVDVRDDEVKLLADGIEPYRPPKAARRRPGAQRRPKLLRVEIPLAADDDTATETVERVFSILTQHHGETPFSLHLVNGHGRVEVAFPEITTAYSPQLAEQVAALVGGPNRVHVEWA
jgi:DNA polymerase-3 subunit alpha